jgi:hypothetical protein
MKNKIKSSDKIVSPNWFFIEGKWHHCVVVEEDNELKHYVDGKFSHAVFQNGAVPMTRFERQLTQKEITDLYNNGKGLTVLYANR